VAGEVLQTAGYKVLEAKNGREALRLVERLTAEVDVLVADIVMPVMNGPELANELTLRYPNMRIIFISGYTDHPLLRRLRVPVRALYLHKPFSVEGLTGVVAQALAKK
jgi:CheY-like chemotaxis protein